MEGAYGFGRKEDKGYERNENNELGKISKAVCLPNTQVYVESEKIKNID